MENWKQLTENMNRNPITVNQYLISLLTGTDAVHGNQHVLGFSFRKLIIIHKKDHIEIVHRTHNYYF